MTTLPAHLTDEQLSVARLEIDDPLALPRLSSDKPSADLTPAIVGEYHLPEEHPRLWCCHCQGHRHHNGFVITNKEGFNYLIGSACGPKHYGLSFSFAKRQHKEKVQRKGVLERLNAICANADLVLAAIQEVARSEGLRLTDQKREELRSASDSAFKALATSVRSGSPLHEIVEVRDLTPKGGVTNNCQMTRPAPRSTGMSEERSAALLEPECCAIAMIVGITFYR